MKMGSRSRSASVADAPSPDSFGQARAGSLDSTRLRRRDGPSHLTRTHPATGRSDRPDVQCVTRFRSRRSPQGGGKTMKLKLTTWILIAMLAGIGVGWM